MQTHFIKKAATIIFLLTFANNCFAENTCIPINQWFNPQTGGLQSFDEYIPQLPDQGIVLLGEHHENTHHHRWQLDVLKVLYKKQPDMAIALEMFPQYLQKILDDWINNKIEKDAFVKLSNWDEIWAYDFNDYLPLFEFAREKHIPLIAINAQKDLLTMVRQVGWKNIPEDHRQGISDPAQPDKNYLRQLAVSFQRHFDPNVKVNKQAFHKFVEQQLLWDRAMAQGIAKSKSRHQLVVGILGSWHIINGFGVPHQLKDLGQNKISTYVPWDEHLDCQSISDQFANAIFGTTN